MAHFLKNFPLIWKSFIENAPPQHSIQDVPPTFCCVKLLFENIELSRGSEWWSIIFFKRFNKVQNVAERRFSFCKNDAKSFSNWFKVVDAKLLLHCQRVLNKVALPINLLNLTKKSQRDLSHFASPCREALQLLLLLLLLFQMLN